MENNEQTRYVDLCDMVIRKSRTIAVVAAKGRSEEASRLAIELCEAVNDIKHRDLMQREQTAPDRFSLATLKVHADVPSNSENGYEERD